LFYTYYSLDLASRKIPTAQEQTAGHYIARTRTRLHFSTDPHGWGHPIVGRGTHESVTCASGSVTPPPGNVALRPASRSWKGDPPLVLVTGAPTPSPSTRPPGSAWRSSDVFVWFQQNLHRVTRSIRLFVSQAKANQQDRSVGQGRQTIKSRIGLSVDQGTLSFFFSGVLAPLRWIIIIISSKRL
jgi:hypothetical protein